MEQRYTDLASELGDTHGLPETGPLVDVGLEVIELDVIPVDGHLDDAAIVITAHFEELGHPIEAIGSRGGDGASESVTLAGERLDILIPNTKRSGRVDVGLRRFVDSGESGLIQADEKVNQGYVLVETVCVFSVTRLGILDEAVDPVLGGAPEHDADGKAGLLDSVWDYNIPKVDDLDASARGDVKQPLVIAHSPSNAKFSGTRGGIGLNVVWRRGRGRLGIVLGGRRAGRLGGGSRRVILVGIGWFRSGRNAAGLGLASLVAVTSLLLLGNPVVVGDLSSQMVRVD